MASTPIQGNIPTELTALPQWCRWKPHNGTKLPIAVDGTRFDSTDSATWCGFDRVATFDRIAFVIDRGDPFTGIDLDGCIVDGSLAEWAQEVVTKFAGVAYCEISPSGTGLKLTTIAKKPEGMRCVHKFGGKKTQIECYDHSRFWTMTGNVYADLTTIGDGQAAVDWLCGKYLTYKRPKAVGNANSFTGTPDIIERASKYLAKMDPAIAGSGGHNATFRAACALVQGFDLPTKDAYSLLNNEYNPRCEPPWSEKDLWHKVESAANQGGERGYLLNEPTSQVDTSHIQPPEKPEQYIAPVDYCDLLEEHPDLYPPVIHGLLRKGETCNIIAAPKVGKSFLSVGLAWCVADGRPWLDFDVEQGRVLIIDNELHEPTLSHRIDSVAYSMQIPHADRRAKIDCISLRGKMCDINGLHQRLTSIEPGRYKLVILDALYRTLPAGSSENDNAAMMAIYNRLDQYAAKLDSAFVVVHHSSKGNQGDKGITDVGAGAGSIARAADSHVIIRPHESEGLAVFEAATRSFKSPEPLSIEFDYPMWYASTEKPEVRQPGRRDSERQAKEDSEGMDSILAKLSEPGKWVMRADVTRNLDMGVSKQNRLISKLISSGRISERTRRKKGGRKTYVFYCRNEPDETE